MRARGVYCIPDAILRSRILSIILAFHVMLVKKLDRSRIEQNMSSPEQHLHSATLA